MGVAQARTLPLKTALSNPMYPYICASPGKSTISQTKDNKYAITIGLLSTVRLLKHKTFRQRYDKVSFSGKYNEKLALHLEEFVDMRNYFDVPDLGRTDLFKFCIRDGARRQYMRIVNDCTQLKHICRSFLMCNTNQVSSLCLG